MDVVGRLKKRLDDPEFALPGGPSLEADLREAIAEIECLRGDAVPASVMDIIEKLDGLQARLLPGDVWQQAIAEAIAEIRRLRAIAGPVSTGPSAADVMEPLRHRVQDGIEAEKALGDAYAADMESFSRRTQSGSVRAKLWD